MLNNGGEESADAHLPLDTAEVAKAKARHKALFDAIAARHKQQGSLASQLIPQPLQARRGQEYRVRSIYERLIFQYCILQNECNFSRS